MPSFEGLRRLIGFPTRTASESQRHADVPTDPVRPEASEPPSPSTWGGFGSASGIPGRGFGEYPGWTQENEDLYQHEDRTRRTFEAWDGLSVRSLDREALDIMPDLEGVDALKSTVPEDRRGTVYGYPDPQDHLGYENSEWKVVSGLRVVAIDAEGMALVRHEQENLYLGSEGGYYDIMPKEDAFARQDANTRDVEAMAEPKRETPVRASDIPVSSKGPDYGLTVVEAHQAASRDTGR